MSVPNQKIITIHQTTEVPFVMVGIQEIREAYAKMPPATFMLYLYLAGNKEGYPLELSPAAFKNAMGYSRSSYYRAVDDLMKLGYIYEDNGHLNFATSPKIGTKGVVQNWEKDDARMKQPIVKDETDLSQKCNEDVSEMNIEINKIDNHKEEKIIKDKAPFSNLSYLKERVSPLGEYDGRRLEDDIMGFWSFDERTQIEQIEKKTVFSKEEAIYIVRHILDRKKRMALLELERIAFMEDE